MNIKIIDANDFFWFLLVVFLNQNIFLALHLKLSRFFLGVEVFRTGILWILALRVGINSKRWSGLASISWKEAQLLPSKMMAHFKLLLLLVPGILGQTHFSNFPIFIKDILLTVSNNQSWNYEFWTFTNFLTNQIVFDKKTNNDKLSRLVLIGTFLFENSDA